MEASYTEFMNYEVKDNQYAGWCFITKPLHNT